MVEDPLVMLAAIEQALAADSQVSFYSTLHGQAAKRNVICLRIPWKLEFGDEKFVDSDNPVVVSDRCIGSIIADH